MKIIDRLMLTLYSIFLAVFSLILIIIPFNISGILSINDVYYILRNVEGNYIYTLIGLALFVISVRFLFSGIKIKRNAEVESFLLIRNDFGEVIISSNTIIGLVQNVCDKFSGIRNIKTKVDLNEGSINLFMRGEVSTEVNIPETSKILQSKVKDYVENSTGAKVSEVKVEISNVASPIRIVK